MKSFGTIAPAIRRLHPELNDQQLHRTPHLFGGLGLIPAKSRRQKTVILVLMKNDWALILLLGDDID